MLTFESMFSPKKSLIFEYLEDDSYQVTFTDLEGNTYSGILERQPTEVELLQKKIKELEAKLSTEQNLDNDN